MSYGTPQDYIQAATFSVGVSGQNEETILSVAVNFSALKTDELAMGTPAVDADALFQHVVDHMASLPEFPGSAEGIELSVVASKNYQTSTFQDVTPTEEPE